MKPIVAVDVDLTLVDNLTPWTAWFNERTGLDFSFDRSGCTHDSTPQMKLALWEAGIEGIDPLDYWRQKDIYDYLLPLPFAAEALHGLSQYGCEILFVTHCVPEHERSKRAFLEKFFPVDGFISTRQKWAVSYDLMIDDNPVILNECVARNPKRVHLQYSYLRGPLAEKAKKCDQIPSWKYVLKFLEQNKKVA